MESGECGVLNSFLCDAASWWLHTGIVTRYRVAMDNFLLRLNLLRLLTNCKNASLTISECGGLRFVTASKTWVQ